MIRATLAIGLAFLLAVALAGCASSSSKGGKQVAVTLTDSGCTPQNIDVASEPVTFTVTNGGTSNVSEMELKNSSGLILGESENVIQGVPGRFSLDLEPGRYVVNCPTGSAEDQGTLVATGTPKPNPEGAPTVVLDQATSGYKLYVEREAGELLLGTRRFVAALEHGNLHLAEELFGPVRSHYEAIEPVAESFGKLDPEIDGRINNVKKISEWHGFHRIEQILWQKHTTDGTRFYGNLLLQDVVLLRHKVRILKFQPAQLANGSVELMNEVTNTKITGEEDRYSHTDLSDFQANVAGSRKAFELLRPALEQTGNGKLVSDIGQRFAAVQRGLDTYRRKTALGFALYGALTMQDRKKFAREVGALDEPLAKVAAAVSGG